MNFDLTDEQRLLQDSIGKLLADTYSFEQRRRYQVTPMGRDPSVWQVFAETGLAALPFSEADGGIGGGSEETMIVMEALGRALSLEPFLPTVVIGGALLNDLATPDQIAALVPGIIGGRTILAYAHEEPGARYSEAIATTAHATRDGYVLNGAKARVLFADSASILLVTAGIAGESAVFAVPADASGLSLHPYPTQDGMRAADLTLKDVVIPPSARLGEGTADARPALARACDIAVAALCAEAVGIMQGLLDMTVDYLKTRKQFGRPIGDFQALQHRAAEMVVEIEQARSMALYAAMMVRQADPVARARALSAAKVQIGQSGRFVGQSAIQLHGGIGMTAEYPAGAAFKRLTMIEKAFGDTDWHIERLASLGGALR